MEKVANRFEMIRRTLILVSVMMLACLKAVAIDLAGLDLWLGSTQLTGDNAGNILNQVDADGNPTAWYDPDSHTLTLNDPTITGINTHDNMTSKIYVKFNSRYNLELIIKGSYHMTEAEATHGLVAYQWIPPQYWNRSSLTFDGDFTFFGESYGISDFEGDITVNSGTLRATATGTSVGNTYGISCHDLTVDSGVDLVELKGIVALNINEDGKLTLADGYEIKKSGKHIVIREAGTLAGLELWLGSTQLTEDNMDNILKQVDNENNPTAWYDLDSHTLTLNDPTITGTHDGCKMFVKFNSSNNLKLIIKGSYQTAKTEAKADKGLGIYQVYDYWGQSSLTLDGDFTFLGESYGIADLQGDITVNSGTLKATATSRAGGDSWGVSCHDLTVESGVDLCELKGKTALQNIDGGEVTLAEEGKLSLVDGYTEKIDLAGLDLWLGSTQLTVYNTDNILDQVDADGNPTAWYDPDSHTLTLNNPTITGTHDGCRKIYVKFNSSNNLELIIKGSYQMAEAEVVDGLDIYQRDNSWGRSSLTFNGDFTFFGEVYGIVDFNGDITVKSGILRATATKTSGGKTVGITCNDLTVESGVDFIELQGKVAMQCFTPILADGYEISNSGNYVLIRETGNPYESYNLWVGSKVVSNRNKDDILGDGKASFDPTTNTLTLDNPIIPGSTKSSKIYSKLPNLTVTGSYQMTRAETQFGIMSDGTLTLNGNFTILSKGVWVELLPGITDFYMSVPLWAVGDITLAGNINVKGTEVAYGAITSNEGNIAVTGGRLQVWSDAYGVLCQNGTFTDEGGVQSICLEGKSGAIYAKNLVNNHQFIEPAGAYFNVNEKTVCKSNNSKAKRILLGTSGHYNLWLGGMQVTSANANDIFGDGKASFNRTTNTLTLDNPTIDCTTTNYVIYCADKNLIVNGDYHMTKGTTENGIFVNNGNLTLDGDFTIRSKGDWQDDGSNSANITYATLLCTTGNITLNGNIAVQGDGVPVAVFAGGDITMTGGNIQASSDFAGAYCNGIITAKGSTESITLDGNGCALYASDFVIDNAEGELLKIYEPEGTQFDPAYKSVYGSDNNIVKLVVLHQPEKYKLWLGATQVNSDNRNNILGNGTTSFDPETNTLTLDNPTISGQTNGCAIYAEHIDLTVKGNATVSTTADCAIKVLYGRLTCEGNISLTGSEYALWSTNGLRLGQTFDVTSPNNAKFNQIGKENTVYESDGNTVAKSVTIQNLDKYRIWLGSTQVTSLNLNDICGDGKAKYDPDTRTLTLNNPTISDTYSNSKIFIQNTDITIKGRYTMSTAESTFGLYISGGSLSLAGDMTFRGNSMGIVTDDSLYIRGNIKAYGDSYTGIQAPKGITLEHGLMHTRLEMACSNGAYEGGHILPAVILVTPNGGTISNLDESTTRIYSNYSGGVEATDVVLEYRYPAHGIGTEDNPYLIRSDDDWNLLAGDIESGMTTAGKYFELLGNITATTMLGTEAFPFNGVFDGRSSLFTLTADISQEDEAFCAPFQYISDATIRNVKVDGSVTGGLDCAGLVGYVSGGTNLIENCKVGTSVSTYLNNCGGVVGHAGSATTTLSGTDFSGNIIGTTRSGSGSDNGLHINVSGAMNAATLVGRSNNDATITLTGCMDLSGCYQPIGQGTANLTVTNTYYTRADKQNTDIDSWSGLAKLAYRVEGLDVALTLTGTTGVEHDNVIYAAQGETVSFTVNPNYVLYTSTAGTFNQDPNNVNNCTLVMPGENVTILDKNISSFTITLNSGEHGTVTVPQSSKVGAAVFINITPDDYYWIDELTVKDGNNNDIEIEFVDMYRYFRMPNSNVTVTATFKKKYSFEDGVLHLICGDFSGGASINSFDPLEIHTVTNPNVTSVVADPGVRFTGYCGGLFQNFSICTSIDLSNVETSTMTAMTGMFAGCSALTSLNLTGINTAQVTDMSHLFEDCILLREFDLSALDISNVKDMYLMFDQCGVCKLTLPSGLVVTPDMGLRDGWYGQVGNEWVYSGWTLLGSGGTVVSTLEAITVKEQERHYARISALPVPMTAVWKHMPNDFVLELPDGQDNSEILDMWDGVTTNVKLTGRVLYKDGSWNTLCVPFEVPYGSAVNSALPDAVIYILDNEYYYADNGALYGYHETTPPTYNTSYDESTGALRLYFRNHGELNAGIPHIVRWSRPDGYVAYDGTNSDACSDIVSPTFTNVTIDKTLSPVTSEDGNVTFMGTYAPFADTEGLMFDEHNTGNGAFQAALQIAEPAPREGYTYGGRFTDAGFTTPATVIPLSDNGISLTTLYEKWTRNTVVLTALNSGSSVAELESNWAGKTVDVSFTRTFTQDVASTICLPYPMTSIPEDGTVYEFVDVQKEDGVWVATMIDATPDANKVTATEAGKPYLFMPSATGDVTFTGTVVVPENVTAGTSTSNANNGTWTFRGTYRRLAYKADGSADLNGSVFGFASATLEVNNVMVNAGEFVKAKDGAGVPAFRAYLTYDGTNNVFRAPMRGSADDTDPDIPDRITLRLLDKNGVVNAVGTINTATGNVKIEQWFDMQGRPVDGTPALPGMYMNNIGSKVMIR